MLRTPRQLQSSNCAHACTTVEHNQANIICNAVRCWCTRKTGYGIIAIFPCLVHNVTCLVSGSSSLSCLTPPDDFSSWPLGCEPEFLEAQEAPSHLRPYRGWGTTSQWSMGVCHAPRWSQLTHAHASMSCTLVTAHACTCQYVMHPSHGSRMHMPVCHAPWSRLTHAHASMSCTLMVTAHACICFIPSPLPTSMPSGGWVEAEHRMPHER